MSAQRRMTGTVGFRALHAEPRTRDPGRGTCVGFTLVEVLVAVAILGISLLAVISIRNDCVVEIGQVVDANDAWTLGTLAMGMVLTAEVLDEGADGGMFEDYPQYRWDVVKTTVEVDVAAEYFPGMDRAAIPHKPKEILRIDLAVTRLDPPPDPPPGLFRMVTYAQKRIPRP